MHGACLASTRFLVFAAGTDAELTVDTGGEPFVRDLTVLDGKRWRSVPLTGTSFRIPACVRGCRVQYRFMLREATRSNAAFAPGRDSSRSSAFAPE